MKVKTIHERLGNSAIEERYSVHDSVALSKVPGRASEAKYVLTMMVFETIKQLCKSWIPINLLNRPNWFQHSIWFEQNSN